MDDNHNTTEAPYPWRRFQCPEARVDDIPLAVRAIFHARCPAGDPEACWPWPCQPGNYGQIMWRDAEGARHAMRASRMAWMIAYNRDIPANTLVLHSCDRPECVNPHHLRLGTHADNQRDAIRRGRWVYVPPTRPRTLSCVPAKPGTVGRH